MTENPNVSVIQMDTVYNDGTNGPFIQTYKFVCAGLLFGLIHDEKTAQEMKVGVDQLETLLGPNVFRKYVHVLLTDRGSEFTAADDMETDADGLRRTRVFYCDPMQSGQKGSFPNCITMKKAANHDSHRPKYAVLKLSFRPGALAPGFFFRI